MDNSSIRLLEGFTRGEQAILEHRRFDYETAKHIARGLLQSLFTVETGEYDNGTHWVEYKGRTWSGISGTIRVNEKQEN